MTLHNTQKRLEELRPIYDQPKLRLQELEKQDQLVTSQIKQQLKAEASLCKAQDQLDTQIYTCRKLHDTGKQLSAAFDTEELLKLAMEFVLYELHFERCPIFLPAEEDHIFRIQWK